MEVHQDARLTPACRQLWMQRIQADRAKADVGRELRISVKTVDKWLR